MASKGRKKDSIHNLSRHWPSHDEALAVLNALDTSEPSIVVAILAVALLEYDLERMLRAKLRRQDDTTWLRITSENGPLSTFSQKINLAYALGTIDEERRKCLTAIKNIRNVFAHSKRLLEFDNPMILEEMAAVKIANRKASRMFKNMLKRDGKEPTGFYPEKAAFIYLSLIISNHLSRRMQGNKKAQSARRRNALAKALMQGTPSSGLVFGLGPLGFASPTQTGDPTTRSLLPTYADLIAQAAQKKPGSGGK